MFVNQRKMTSTKRNSQWRHQQKAYQNKGEFFKKTWTFQSRLIEIEMKAEKMKNKEKWKLFFFQEDYQKPIVPHETDQNFDYSYDGGQVSLSTFVGDQFNLIKDKFSKISRRSREKAVSNSLIVKEILSHMNFSTLITARLVCKEWKNLANFELGRRNCCRLRFERNFLVKEDLNLSVLRNSVDLSWLELDFQYLEEMELECIAKFCGGKIRRLKMCPSDFPLLNRLFNAGEFPNVKSLSFHDDCDCENSETITKPPLPREFWNLFKLLRKKSKLKSINSSAKAPPKPEVQLERLSIGNQDLDDFEDDFWAEFVGQVDQILELHQKSLKFLELPLPVCSSSSSTFQPQIRIPGILSQVSTIHFHIHCDDWQETFSRRFQLSQGFDQKNLPNLKTVRFQFIHFDRWGCCEFLPPEDMKTGKASCSSLSMRSVINLEVGFKNNSGKIDDCSSFFYLRLSQWFPWFSSLMPNIESVALDNWIHTDEILHPVFTAWPNLITLNVQGHFSSRFRTDSKNLDSIFTGLSKAKCDELRKNPELVPMSTEIEEMKTEPNLNSLNELKRLDIRIIGSPFWCPVSKLSSLYAFDLNPELKVTIRHFPKEVKECECSKCVSGEERQIRLNWVFPVIPIFPRLSDWLQKIFPPV